MASLRIPVHVWFASEQARRARVCKVAGVAQPLMTPRQLKRINQKSRRHEKQVGDAEGAKGSQDWAQVGTTAALCEPQAPASFKYIALPQRKGKKKQKEQSMGSD
eukprot:219185-Pelagomonas_calceolata.AAC.1